MKKYFKPCISGVAIFVSIHVFSQTNTFPSSGSVGIGTTSPQTKLHITAGTPAFRIEDSNGSNASFYSNYLDYAQLSINRNPSTGAFLNTSKASAQLSIYGGAGDGHFEFYTSNSNNTTPTEKMRITGSGNVGIGTTTPDAKLTVIGNADVGDGTDPTKYGILQLARPANQGDYKFHLSFIRNGNSISGMGYALNSNVLGIWHSNNNSGTPTMSFTSDQKVGIGTSTPQAKLAVNGDVYAKKVKVTQTGWPDYVFQASYRLRPLSEVEQYINQYHHLPEILSAKEIENNGLDLGDNQATLLKKIEELTLYIINLNKDVESLKTGLRELKVNQN